MVYGRCPGLPPHGGHTSCAYLGRYVNTWLQRGFSIFLFPCEREDYILIPTSAENWRESDLWAYLGDLGWQPILQDSMILSSPASNRSFSSKKNPTNDKFSLSIMTPSMVVIRISIVSTAAPLGSLLSLHQSSSFSGYLSQESLSLWANLSQKLHLILPFPLGHFLGCYEQQSISLLPILP